MLPIHTLHTHCDTLQHTATHCDTLRHTATHCHTLQHTATHCDTQQLGTNPNVCDTLQHPATPCNTLQHTTARCRPKCARQNHEHPPHVCCTRGPLWNLPRIGVLYRALCLPISFCPPIFLWSTSCPFVYSFSNSFCVHVWIRRPLSGLPREADLRIVSPFSFCLHLSLLSLRV